MPDRGPSLITSTRNPRIVAARKLDQRKQRKQQGRFLAEGLQLLHMALDAGARPLEVFFCEALFAGREAPALLDRLQRTDSELSAVSPHVMQALSERDAPQGIAATFALFEREIDALGLAKSDLVVVLDRLQDPGNMGTLIRTADAAGAAAVVLVEPCVDPFDPKTVRGSMGSLFNLPPAHASDVPDLFARLSRAGLRIVGADAQRGEAWGGDALQGGVALVLGNEAHGLSNDVRPHVEAWARLPIFGKAESLNVAVAGGVLMYEWLKANRPAGEGRASR